jgi:hypothetical protein
MAVQVTCVFIMFCIGYYFLGLQSLGGAYHRSSVLDHSHSHAAAPKLQGSAV